MKLRDKGDRLVTSSRESAAGRSVALMLVVVLLIGCHTASQQRLSGQVGLLLLVSLSIVLLQVVRVDASKRRVLVGSLVVLALHASFIVLLLLCLLCLVVLLGVQEGGSSGFGLLLRCSCGGRGGSVGGVRSRRWLGHQACVGAAYVK